MTIEFGKDIDLYVYYQNEKRSFRLPRDWNLIAAEDRPPIARVSDPIGEIRCALDQPIGLAPMR